MVEWQEGIPEEVRAIIERVDPDKIVSINVEHDEQGRVHKVLVRREGMLAEQAGFPQPYNTNVEYDITYSGDRPTKVHSRAEFEGDAGYNAKMEYVKYGTGQAPEETIEL